MLNKERIRQMTALAEFEQEKGKKDIRISHYYCGDYIAIILLKNFFITTIGYFLVLGLWAMWKLDWLMDGMNSMNLGLLVFLLAASYVGMLVLYSALTVYTAWKRHREATGNARTYTRDLGSLIREYEKEERKQRKRRNSE